MNIECVNETTFIGDRRKNLAGREAYENCESNHVSVIIPCYNAEQSITGTLLSVLLQNHQNFEVIVVDDGSTDGSEAAIEHIMENASNGNKIKLISQNNQGVSVARNQGVANSSGNYLAFLDADDLWHHEKLSTHLHYMNNHPQVGVSFARVQFMNSEGKVLQRTSSLPLGKQDAAAMFAENPTTTTSNLFMRRSVFEQAGGFDETMQFAEDQEFLIRILHETEYEVTGIDPVLTYYRASENGLSSKLPEMEAGWLHMVSRVKTYAPEFVKEQLSPAKALYYRYLARRSVRLSSSAKEGMAYLIKALRSDWTLFIRDPSRSLPTLFAVVARRVVSSS